MVTAASIGFIEACKSDFLPEGPCEQLQRAAYDGGSKTGPQEPASRRLQECVEQADRFCKVLYFLQPGGDFWAGLQDPAIPCSAPECGPADHQKLAVTKSLYEYGLEAIDLLVGEASKYDSHRSSCFLLSSGQHASLFCNLLDQLYLLDQLKASKAHLLAFELDEGLVSAILQTAQGSDLGTLEAQIDNLQAFVTKPSFFLSCIEAALPALDGSCALLAGLLQHLQSELCAPEGILLSQARHSLARSLPVVLRMYLKSEGRAKVLAEGKAEPLPLKVLERCVQWVLGNPVVPGYADMPADLLALLLNQEELQLMAQRNPKLIVSRPAAGSAQAQKIDQRYDMAAALNTLCERHDTVCDLISQLALEVRELQCDKEKRKKEVPSQVMAQAASVVALALQFAAATRAGVMELDAWRLAQADQQQPEGDVSTSTGSRYCLQDRDVVPVTMAITMLKGLEALVTNSKAWLDPLVQGHALKQLRDLHTLALPVAAASQPHNKRIQKLAMAIQSCLLGEEVELPDDLWASEGRGPAAAAAGEARPASRADSSLSGAMARAAAPFRLGPPGPLAEAEEEDGLEGLGGEESEEEDSQWPLQEEQQTVAARPGRRRKERGSGPPEEEEEEEPAAGEGAAAAATTQLPPTSCNPIRTAVADAATPGSIRRTCSSASMGQAGSNPGSPSVSRSSNSRPILLGPFNGNPAAAARARKSALEAASAADLSQEGEGAGAAGQLDAGAAELEQQQQQAMISPEVYAAMYSCRTSEAGSLVYEQAGPVPASRLSRAGNGSQDLLQVAPSMSDLNAGSLSQFEPLPSELLEKPISEAAAGSSRGPAQRPQSPLKKWGKKARSWAKKTLHIGKGSVQPVAVAPGLGGGLLQQLEAQAALEAAAEEDEARDGLLEPVEAEGAAGPEETAAEELAAEAGDGATTAPGDAAAGMVVQQADGDEGAAAAAAGAAASKGPERSGLKQHLHFNMPSFKLAPFKQMRQKREAAHAASAAAGQAVASSHAGAAAAPAAGDGQLLQSSSGQSRRETGLGDDEGPGKDLQQQWGEEEGQAGELRLSSAVSSAPATPGGRQWSSQRGAPPAQAGQGLPPELALLQRLQEYMGPGRSQPAGELQPYDAAGAAATGPEPAAGSSQEQQQGEDAPDVDDSHVGPAAVDQKLRLQRLRSALSLGPRTGRRSSTEEGGGSRASKKPLQKLQSLRTAFSTKLGHISNQAPDAGFERREPLIQLPSGAALSQVVFLLEQLKQELQLDPKWQMLCKLMGPAQADAKFQPVKGIQEGLRAVKDLQGLMGFPSYLAAAADLSDLWLDCATQHRADAAADAAADSEQEQVDRQRQRGGRDGGSSSPTARGIAAGQGWGQLECENLRASWALSSEKAAQQQSARRQGSCNRHGEVPPSSFPSLLMAKGSMRVDQMPADGPLAVMHIWWDAWSRLAGFQQPGQLLARISGEMEEGVELYLGCMSELAYEHFKSLSAHQLVTSQMLLECRAAPLPALKPFYFDTLLDSTGEEGAPEFSSIAAQQQAAQQLQAYGMLDQPMVISRATMRAELRNQLMCLLQADVRRLDESFRTSDATALVELAAQLQVLRRTHQLLSEYVSLPLRWSQLWDAADVAAVEVNEWSNKAAEGSIQNILAMLHTAAFDSHAQVLLPAATADQQQGQQRQPLSQQQPAAATAGASPIPEEGSIEDDASSLDRDSSSQQEGGSQAALEAAASATAVPGSSSILAEVQRVLHPYRAFFGRQHLMALQQLGGFAALCRLREAILCMLQKEQGALASGLQDLQRLLPPQLIQPPLLERCHDAVSVHATYHKQLEPALRHQGLCQQVLSSLQRGGNCLALVHLLSMHRSWAATPAFAQVAPLLGIYADPGRPETATQEEGGLEEEAGACLRMPRVQNPGLGKNSYFEQMILGPDAKLVRGLPLHIVQSAELHAWEATEGWDLLPSCMAAVGAAVQELNQQLTMAVHGPRECSQAAGSASPMAVQPAARAEEQQQQQPAGSTLHAPEQQQQQQQPPPSAVTTPVRGVQAGPRGEQTPSALADSDEEVEDSGNWVANGTLPSPGPLGDGLVVVQLAYSRRNSVAAAAADTTRQQAEEEPVAAVAVEQATEAEGIPVSSTGAVEAPAPVAEAAGVGAGDAEEAPAAAEAGAGAVPAADASGAVVEVNNILEDLLHGLSSSEREAAPAAAGASEDASAVQAAASASGQDPWAAADAAAAALPPGAVPASPTKLAYQALLRQQQQPPAAAVQPPAVTADQYCAMEFAAAAAFDTGLGAFEQLQTQASHNSRAGSEASSRQASMCSWQALPSSARAAALLVQCKGDPLLSSRSSRPQHSAGTSPGRDSRRGRRSARTPRHPKDEDQLSEPSDSDDGRPSPRSPRRGVSPSRLGLYAEMLLAGSSFASARGTGAAAAATNQPAATPSEAAGEAAAGVGDSLQHEALSEPGAGRAAQGQQQQPHSQQEEATQTEAGAAAAAAASLAEDMPELQQAQSPCTRNRGSGGSSSHDEVMEEVMAVELLRVTQERDRLQGRVSLLETEVKNKDVMLHMLGGVAFATPRESGDLDSMAGAEPAGCEDGHGTDQPLPAPGAASGAAAEGAMVEPSSGSPVAVELSVASVLISPEATEAALQEPLDTPPAAHPSANAEMLASVVQQGADRQQGCHLDEAEEMSQASLQVQDVSDAPSNGSYDDPEGLLAKAKEYTFPVALHAPSPPVQLAGLVSALRYIMLHQLVNQDFGAAAAAGSSSSSSSSGTQAAGEGEEGLGGLVGGALQGIRSSPMKLKRMLSGKAPSSPGGLHGMELPARQQHGSAAAAAAAAAPAPADTTREHLAGGLYGDGPLWAACVMLHLLGLQHAWRRMDICRQLSHWHSYNTIRPSSPPAVGLDDTELTQEEQQQLRHAHRAAHQAHMQWLGRLVAADARAQYAWALATSALGARFAPLGRSRDPVAFQALAAAEPLVCGPNPEPFSMLQPEQRPIRPAPKGAQPPATLLRQSMSGLPPGILCGSVAGAGGAGAGGGSTAHLPKGARPGFAPAKAGLISSALAADQVARFRSSMPATQAYSCSALRDDTNASTKTCSTTNYFKGVGSVAGRSMGARRGRSVVAAADVGKAQDQAHHRVLG